MILSILRDLRGSWECVPFRHPEFTSTNWLISAVNDLDWKIARLAKQEAELISLEMDAEKAALPSTTEVLLYDFIIYQHTHSLWLSTQVIQQDDSNPSSSTRRLFGRRKNPPSKTSLITMPPSFTEFDDAGW